MKAILLCAVLLLSSYFLRAQDSDLFKRKPETAVVYYSGSDPLFIFKLENKKFEIPDENNFRDTTVFIGNFHSDWIHSINVLKDSSEVHPFGLRAEHGVVIIELKKEAQHKMPTELLSKFKDKKF
jgi:hypothetical protein